jgi:hypothetical protein
VLRVEFANQLFSMNDVVYYQCLLTHSGTPSFGSATAR